MQGGKTFNDRIKSATVRNKVLDAMLKVYEGKDSELSQRQWELTLRMSNTILPRLQEVTGEDGAPIKVQITGMEIINENSIQNKEPETVGSGQEVDR